MNFTFTEQPNASFTFSGFMNWAPTDVCRFECGRDFSGNGIINFGASSGCTSQFYSTGPVTPGIRQSNMSFNITWSVDVSLSGTTGSYCESEQVTISNAVDYGLTYSWKYRIGGGSWNSFATPPGAGSSITFDATDVFGSNSSNLTKNIYFQSAVGNCTDQIGPYVFYPDLPVVTSTTVSGVECKGDRDWQIEVTGTSRPPMTGESFSYEVRSSPVVDPLIDNLHFSSTTSTLTSMSVSDGLPADQTYYILVISSLDSTLQATGCGTPIFDSVYVDEPNTALMITPAPNDESCRSSNDGSVTINASGGWGSYEYSLGSSGYGSENTFTGLSSGTYTAGVRDREGCEKTVDVTISQPPAELSISANGTDETCRSANDGTITITGANGWGSYEYRLNSGLWQSGGSFTGLTAGTYTAQVRDSGGCSKSTSVVIGQPATELAIGYTHTHEICRASNNGSISLTASGGWGSYDYRLNSGTWQTGGAFTGLAAGTYTAQIRDSGGCIKSASVTISQPSVELAMSTTIQNTCKGTSEGSITVTASGGWLNYEYSKDNGATYQTSNIFSNLGVGSYQVRVRDSGGCITSAQTVTISEPATTLSFTTSKQNVDCRNSSTGSITVSATGSWGTYEYSKDNGVTYQASAIFSNLIADTYAIKVRDIEGCETSSQTVTINEPTTGLSFSTSKSPVTCQGDDNGSITVIASGGWSSYEYSKDNGATYQSSNIFNNLVPGLYQVRVRDGEGCVTAKEDIIISEPTELLSVSISQTDVICKGAADGTITLTGGGGWGSYSYSIDGGTTYQTSGNFAALVPGDYSVVVQDLESCTTAPQTISVAEPSENLAVTNTVTHVTCKGADNGVIELNATGGWGSYEYSIDATTWQTTNTFINLPAGDYTIDLRDANGCSTSTTATITEPTVLTGSVFNVVKSTCGEDNGSAEASASGGTVDYSYTWRNSLNEVVSTSSTLTNVGGGIYIVTITDANGCSTTGQANISSADGAQVTFTDIVSTSCFNSSDGQASMNITGSAPFDVEWQNGETGEEATALSPGDNVVTVTDVNGCVVVEVVNIPSPTAIDYTVASSMIPSCHDSSDGSIAVQASGGSGGYTYSWSTGDTGTSLDNIPSGTYNLTITDANGCALDTEVVLGGLDPVSLTIDNTTLPTCVGDADGSITVSAAGGNGGYSYSWNTGTTGAEIDQLSAGSYEVTVTDSKGCTLTQNIDLPDPAPFTIDIGNEVEICTGSSYVIASDVDNAIYSWTSDNGFTSTDQEVTLSEQGTYNLHVTNADGCEAEDSFTLIVSDDLLNADFLMTTEAYVGDTVVIIDISWPIPEALTWQFPAEAIILMENQDYAEVVFDTPGTYGVDMEVALADCQDFYSQSITILEGKPNTGGRLSEGEELIRKFTAYPNPNDGEFKALVELSIVQDIRLTLVDLDGNIIVFDRKYGQSDTYEVALDLPRLRSGIYLLGLQTGGKSKTLRLMVK
ncbi:internalin, putative [Fulvivirga imtechensis AK7]|uniref:Internalin, putative n=1 Tax=Fulvivirga imtechensis AK7 TaxID=1237149 RepID=L8K197_9BACT|nr:T9SS type A sorting domain-containing protein [Fulvivirga imtechensis]ELR73222.1 internalin, putative [Fulvivirga imtechensis AK7]